MFTHIEHEVIRPFAKSEHTKDGHFYRTVYGKLYPSITTIFSLLDPKEWYPMWVKSVMKKEKITEKDAEKWCKENGAMSMKVGTQLHKYAELYMNNEDTIFPNDTNFEKDPLTLFRETLKPWLDENIEEVHGIEQELYSDELELAGTVDLIAKLKTGEMVIIDFKNSRKPKTPGKIKDAHYYEQMVAYAKMWEFCTGMKIETGIVLVASWDDKVRAFKCKLADHESDLWTWILRYEEHKCLNTII